MYFVFSVVVSERRLSSYISGLNCYVGTTKRPVRLDGSFCCRVALARESPCLQIGFNLPVRTGCDILLLGMERSHSLA